MDEKYLPELMAEKDSLDPSFTHALRLVNQEIEKFQKGEGKEEEKYIDVVINKNMKLGQKVLIPVKQFPKFNFVGKLLGPRGNSLKRLQEETLTKMSILGKGSMRDKTKEEELRKSGEAKYFHLNDDLHVLIEVFAPPAEAYARMGHALEEIKKFLIPEYDDGYGTAYDEQSYDSYDNSYSTQAQSGADYYDYGHGLSEETYDSYGQEEWTNSRHKAPSARTTKGVYRDQPYARY
ncbi:KH domain-containing, RNA-binding, signal transduction-associated protein 3 isoform C [Patagioenas fasciata monilis]|uniref:KH domain-containing, RNA-binding, signal transduction-associated protein 3 isoform C n=1 Tax=Patagioenas fasciata monilis TaxID=372326 RepID=A0A1V4JTT4_PATFA|nr:KH domain-containing, RNA-binding, signal transduction-associated protein 3 isoform C [Patagioenas fasciata monilis]